MKLSKRIKQFRRGRHTKRSGKHTRRKYRGKQYKRTYRKNSRKLKNNKRIQRGGGGVLYLIVMQVVPNYFIKLHVN